MSESIVKCGGGDGLRRVGVVGDEDFQTIARAENL